MEHRVRAPKSDDVLRHIFLFLDSPADLARACAASPTFRRIITDPRFLRRFRALHPPRLLGVFKGVFIPAEPPHPSAAAAQAFVYGAAGAFEFYCFSFLPSSGPWFYLDSLDGRILFYSNTNYRESCHYSHHALARRLAVCDPLHRRCRVLPPIPEELAALVGHMKEVEDYMHFLAPPAEDDDSVSSSSPPFRVMSLIQCVARLVLFVFSSSAAGGKWQAVTFDRWSDVCNGGGPSLLRRYYMNGRFFWSIMFLEKKLLVLDARRTMPEFSTVNLPSYVRYQAASDKAAFVQAIGEQEKLGVLTIHKHREHDVYHLLYAIQRDDDGDQWEPEAIIYLPLRHHDYRLLGVAGGYLLLEGFPEGWHDLTIKRPDSACFSLDLQTLQLHWFCGNKHSFLGARPYAGFPPYLSPPTV